MVKKIAFASVGLLLLASPLLASAQTASDLQTKIQALFDQVRQLQAQLIQLKSAGSTTIACTMEAKICPDGGTGAPPSRICPQILRMLDQGISGSDVKELQAYLGVSQTGYFGPLTARAVAAFQAEEGLSQVGIVGPQTRAAFARRCGWGNQNFTASPTSGKAPLQVNFSTNLGSLGTSAYSIDFGDGQTGADFMIATTDIATTDCGPNAKCAVQRYGRISHTYTQDGTYTAKLMYQEPFVCDAPPGAACMMVVANPKVVGTVMIRVGQVVPSCPIYSPPNCTGDEQLVGGGIGSDGCQLGPRCVSKTPTTPGAPVVNGIDGPSSLAVGEQGTWTVHASVSSGTDQDLRYSVVWGDEARDAFAGISSLASAKNLQASASFTHAYSTAGTYIPRFTASNSAGSAQTSASVVVGKDTVPLNCPQYMAPLCNANETLVGGGYGADGCQLAPRCVPKTSDVFSASPTSGAAPLLVHFSGTVASQGYSIDFGDASSSGDIGCIHGGCPSGGSSTVSANHTYVSAGTYTAKLRQHFSSNAGNCAGVDCNVVGTAMITVGGGSTSSGTFTATPATGDAPLMVTFTGIGNSISFGDEGPLFIAAGNGNLGTMTHVYQNGGDYTATSGGRSVRISVTYGKLASFANRGASQLCVYNDRTYQSGASVDVPTKTCTRGTAFSGVICDKLAIGGNQTSITPQRYTCSNGAWTDSNGAGIEGALVSATSCVVSDGTVLANGQIIAQGVAAIAFDQYNTYGKRFMTTKCTNGTLFSCDATGGNCTQAGSADTNANLANALTALELALQALLSKLGL